MAKRYYLSRIIGDGSSPDNAKRPAVADMGVNWVGEIKEGAEWALVLVNTVDHRPLHRSADVFPLADTPLDIKLNAIQTSEVNRMTAGVQARGFAVTTSNSDGFRDLLRGIGRQLNPNFDENNFDVSE